MACHKRIATQARIVKYRELSAIHRSNRRLVEAGFTGWYGWPTFTVIKPTIDNELSPGARSSGDFLFL